MTPELETKINEMHALLAGTLDKKGLVHDIQEMKVKVKELDKYKTNDEKFKQKIAGGVAVGTPIAVIAWHWFTDWLKGK